MERMEPGSSIYINILHSLEGQDHDINYDFAFFVAGSHYWQSLLWAEALSEQWGWEPQ